MVVPASGRGNGGGGYQGGGYIRPQQPEHFLPVYFYSYDNVFMPGVGTAAGSMGIMTVVGAVQNWPWHKGVEIGRVGNGCGER